MRATDLAIRRCIDRFADDLIELAEQVIHEQVDAALARIATPPAPRRERAKHAKAERVKAERVKAERAKAEKKVEAKAPRPARHKLTAVEKLERAQERKRQRQLALPFAAPREVAGDVAAGAEGAAAPPPKPRGRRKATVASTEKPANSTRAPAPAAPPPLFVVKRTRDGSIQTMQRKAEEEAKAAAAAVSEAPAPPA